MESAFGIAWIKRDCVLDETARTGVRGLGCSRNTKKRKSGERTSDHFFVQSENTGVGGLAQPLDALLSPYTKEVAA